MAGFYGADVEQLRSLGGELSRQATALESIVSRLTPKVEQVSWTGPDAQRFLDDWHARLAVLLRKVAEELQGASQRALQNATAQEDASNGSGAASPTFNGAGAPGGIGA